MNIDNFKIDQDLLGGNNPSNWYYEGPLMFNDLSPYQDNGLVFHFPNLPHDEYLCNDIIKPLDDDRADMLRKALQDSTEYTELIDENIYAVKRAVYQTLNEEPQLMFLGKASDADLQAFYASQYDGNIDKFTEVKDLAQQGDKAQAATKNQLVIDNNFIETNTKIVNEIYLEDSENDTLHLTADHIETLESIAYLFPMIGGEAVYRARAMLGIYLDQSLIAFRKGKTNTVNHLFSVFPNPANNSCTIALSALLAESDCLLTITDAQGRVVMKKEFNAENYYTINTSLFDQGIYHVTISNAVHSGIEKLAVLH